MYNNFVAFEFTIHVRVVLILTEDDSVFLKRPPNLSPFFRFPESMESRLARRLGRKGNSIDCENLTFHCLSVRRSAGLSPFPLLSAHFWEPPSRRVARSSTYLLNRKVNYGNSFHFSSHSRLVDCAKCGRIFLWLLALSC